VAPTYAAILVAKKNKPGELPYEGSLYFWPPTNCRTIDNIKKIIKITLGFL
jgi:hypothetical protein